MSQECTQNIVSFPVRFAVRLSTAPSDGGALRILALGAESSSSLCLLDGEDVQMSASLGDINQPDNYRRFQVLLDQLLRRGDRAPDVIAHDLHPHYHSTDFARRTGLPTIGVQHHHAHIASVMAEHDEPGPVIGVACDGAGYGADGTVWGCEILHCNNAGFRRIGHLENFALVGGDAAAIETWRPAAALLRLAFGAAWISHWPAGRSSTDLPLVEQLLNRPTRAHLTSSLGRVFDGVAFLLGLCDVNDRQACAAQALEKIAATESPLAEPYGCRLVETGDDIILPVAPLIRDIVAARRSGEPIARISARYHETLAVLLAEAALRAAERAGISTVALSGGCFMNRRLRQRVVDRLQDRGLRVLTPDRISPGDAGLSLGQAAVAMARMLSSADDSAPSVRNEMVQNVSCGAGADH